MINSLGGVDLKEVEQVQWWLMWCDFPNLNWARLRVFADGSSDVFDMDGRTFQFPNEQEARYFLAEDEFQELSTLHEEDERELGMPLALITPPSGTSDEELLSRMYVKLSE